MKWSFLYVYLYILLIYFLNRMFICYSFLFDIFYEYFLIIYVIFYFVIYLFFKKKLKYFNVIIENVKYIDVIVCLIFNLKMCFLIK